MTLGIAQQLGDSLRSLKNIPGSITDLFEKTSTKFNADYILIDMSPALSSINQNLLMTSDFFLVPTTADSISVMAIDSLAKVLPKWYTWAKKASSLPILQDAAYPFPNVTLHFLGIVVFGKETAPFQTWIKKVEQAISDKLVPVLRQNNMLLSETLYTEQGINRSFSLTEISNFHSLISLSQAHRTPIYDLTPKQLGQIGIVLKNNQEKQKQFKQTFSDLADKIIALTSVSNYAVSAWPISHQY